MGFTEEVGQAGGGGMQCVCSHAAVDLKMDGTALDRMVCCQFSCVESQLAMVGLRWERVDHKAGSVYLCFIMSITVDSSSYFVSVRPPMLILFESHFA